MCIFFSWISQQKYGLYGDLLFLPFMRKNTPIKSFYLSDFESLFEKIQASGKNFIGLVKKIKCYFVNEIGMCQTMV